MKALRFIRDPIHQNIVLSDADIELLDTREMQRLRGVKQTGVVYLVYPGATHTRFEHSIGTRYLAGEILNVMKVYGAEIPGDEEELVKLAALLHDVAHPPFSHSLDPVIGGDEVHEQIALDVMRRGEVGEVLSKHGYSAEEVWRTFSRGRGLGSVVRGDIDADRLDYLRRDAYYAGVAYGVIDTRILMEFRYWDGEVVLSFKGLRPAESVLFARYLMYNTVYYHKTVRIASSMLTRAVFDALSRGLLSLDELLSMTDCRLMEFLLNTDGEARRLGERVAGRKLYKMACRRYWGDVPRDALKKLLRMGERMELNIDFERKLAGEAGVDHLILDIPPSPVLEEAEVKILTDDGPVDIKRLSPIAEAFTASYRRSWSFAVYVPERRAFRGDLCEMAVDLL